MAFFAHDLTKQPPRSPRVRLGGFVILPRILDKGRAVIAGKNGEYNYACPMDQQFLTFAGIDPAALKEQLAAGKGDGQILEWITANSKNKPAPWQIAAWSSFQEHRAPADCESREFFQEVLTKIGSKREDVSTWFEMLDLDDYVSFGGNV
jgi:hypothetical protein